MVKIDRELCNGCGSCITGCHEGALQLIDGKAVLVSDSYCDGLGACIGECPVGAITLEEREAVPFDEAAVNARMAEGVRLAATGKLIESDGIAEKKTEPAPLACGCPGSMAREIRRPQFDFAGVGLPAQSQSKTQPSELRQFPVQLHLVNPGAKYFQGADMLLAADCTAFACGDFHSRFLRGNSLAIACPKLDNNTQIYEDKLVEMIDSARIDTLTVLVMEVPCCGGLVRLATNARERAQRNVPVKVIVLSVAGEIISDNWI
jgi:NAD-dependent dihydropyrimidine dehydrogenase PreA subunit